MSEKPSSQPSTSAVTVFHEGRIIQEGTHEELLTDNDGKYSQLWNAQAQYYRENDIRVS